MAVYSACNVRPSRSFKNLIHFQMHSVNLHFMIRCGDFVYVFSILLTSPTNQSSYINCRYSVKLDRILHPCAAAVVLSLSDFAWLILTTTTTFTPSSDENWFVLFGFSLCFSPQRFFSAMSAVYFPQVCPSHKRKGHTARPQTTGKGRYKCYWNWLLIFPVLNACPLRRRAVSSLSTELGGFPLIVGVLFIHVLSV